MRRIGNRSVSWLVVAAVTAMLSPVSILFAAQNGPNTVNSAAIIAADGASGQTLTTGSGVKTGHIQDGAVTDAKIAGPISTSKLNIGTSAGTVSAGDHSHVLSTVNIADGAVTDAKITGVISGSKLGAHGHNASDLVGTVNASNLPVGTASGTVAAGDHSHDSAIQKKYSNVIVVAKSGGDFTDPMSALNSIADASAANTYLVKIMPGTYEIPGGGAAINAVSFVDIEGSGKSVTKLRVLNNLTQGGGGIVIYAYNVTNSEIRDITLEAETTINGARSLRGIMANGSSYKAQNVDINIIGNGDNYGVLFGSGGKSYLKNIKVTFSGAAISGTGVAINGPAELEDITVEAQANMSDYIQGIYYHGDVTPVDDISIKNLKLIGFNFSNIRHFGAYVQANNSNLKFYDSILGRVSIHTGAQLTAVNSMIDVLNTRSADGLNAIYGKFKGVNCYNSNFDSINLNN